MIIVHDVMVLIETLLNTAASRGERDMGRLLRRIEAIVTARLDTA